MIQWILLVTLIFIAIYPVEATVINTKRHKTFDGKAKYTMVVACDMFGERVIKCSKGEYGAMPGAVVMLPLYRVLV